MPHIALTADGADWVLVAVAIIAVWQFTRRWGALRRARRALTRGTHGH